MSMILGHFGDSVFQLVSFRCVLFYFVLFGNLLFISMLLLIIFLLFLSLCLAFCAPFIHRCPIVSPIVQCVPIIVHKLDPVEYANRSPTSSSSTASSSAAAYLL